MYFAETFDEIRQKRKSCESNFARNANINKRRKSFLWAQEEVAENWKELTARALATSRIHQ